jgi:uracil-DNA glycosylase family 4
VARPDPEPVAEALLYLQWTRGAVGRFFAGGGGPQGGAGGEPCSPSPDRAQAPSAPTPSAPPSPIGPGAAPPPVAPAAAGVPDPLDTLRREAEVCRRCRLCETRTQVVFGEGSPRPRLMVIGEAPGADEDATGRPFVGRAGQLLTRMLAAIGLSRDDVFIGNVLKCRPPDNRPPAPDEAAACRPFLEEQMRLLDPELLLLLGNHAARAVLATDRGITSLRGRILTTPGGRRALPTFHPAYLLRNPDAKREAWADLQLAARTLGLPLPGRSADPGAEG